MSDNKRIVFKTNHGDFTVELLPKSTDYGRKFCQIS